MIKHYTSKFLPSICIPFFLIVFCMCKFYRSTAELENFENFIQMYCGRGFDYSPLVYRARCQLAALDYNANVDREAKRNSDETVQYVNLL